jgi:Flp pilus assembly protein TadG
VSRTRGQSTVEFGASALVLILILFGLIDLGRVFYYDVGLQGAVREGARQASWFDSQTGTNPYLYDGAIQSSVDAILTHSGLPASTLGNSNGTTCPAPTDGNATYNPPYSDSAYPTTLNQPVLYICYSEQPGLDLSSPPGNNSYKATDVNVILVMSFGFASSLLGGTAGIPIHIVAHGRGRLLT